MRGAPARAIQDPAGHADLATTQRYMHLSPAALDAAIRLLETGTEVRGGIVEAAGKRAKRLVFPAASNIPPIFERLLLKVAHRGL